MNSSPLPEAKPPAPPISFRLIPPPASSEIDARYDESLLDQVLAHGPVASIWQTCRSLVVPRSYRRFGSFDTACEDFSRQGWPIVVRQTGGGIVPQGPGIINLSLAYPVQGQPMQHSEPGYQLICRVLASALKLLGLDAFPAAVEGSFCDGRYNLAVQRQGLAVKIAGTAQNWRRVPGTPDWHHGLVHALVLLDTDCVQLTDMANAFEAAIRSERRYQANKVVSIAELLGHPPDLQARFVQALEQTLQSTTRDTP